MSLSDEPYEGAKAVVHAYYSAGQRGELTSFGDYLDAEFVVQARNYLPWGGIHPGAAYFRDEVLPNLPDVLDFGRFRYVSFTAEGNHVVALIEVRVTGTNESVKISEHWNVKDGKATSLWVAYFEPQPLLRKLGLAEAPLAAG